MQGGDIVNLLNILLIVIVGLIFILGIVAILMVLNIRKKKAEKEGQLITDTNKSIENNPNMITRNGKSINSIYKFMEFDEIKDGMIIRKNRTQYVMVLNCKGLNYDLLSEEEKYAVENGFIAFLNTLRFSVQLYVQTRKLDLSKLIKDYSKRTDALEEQIRRIDSQIKVARDRGDEAIVEKLAFDRQRNINILEYGQSIEEYTAKINESKNMLTQKTYLILSYYSSELGDTSKYSKEEISDLVFSELYTRAETLVRALGSAEVSAEILGSEELAELLYIAYNRDEAETYTLENALDANYSRLYSTAKDVFEEKKKKLREGIQEDASKLASQSIVAADKKLREEKMRRNQLVKEKAAQMVNEYKDELNKPLYDATMETIKNATTDEDGNLIEDTSKKQNATTQA